MKQSDKRWVTSLSLSKPRMGLILRAMHWDRLKLSLYIKLFYIYELFSTPSSSLSVYRHCCGIIAIVITGISHWEKEGEREGERKWRKKKKKKWLFQRNRLISVGETSQTAVCDVMEMIDCNIILEFLIRSASLFLTLLGGKYCIPRNCSLQVEFPAAWAKRPRIRFLHIEEAGFGISSRDRQTQSRLRERERERERDEREEKRREEQRPNR